MKLGTSVEDVIKVLEKMPIVLSLNALSNELTGKSVMARVFVCLWHESSHYLLRYLCDDYLASTPRANGDEDGVYSSLEGGYRLERFLFGTHELRIWLDVHF